MGSVSKTGQRYFCSKCINVSGVDDVLNARRRALGSSSDGEVDISFLFDAFSSVEMREMKGTRF
jgi:hypothetical protein